MPHLLLFIGRFHVLALHLPITLVLVVAALEWLRWRGQEEFEPALRVLWAATALSALLTAGLGYLHFAEGGFTGRAALAHRAFGTALALVSCLAWALRARLQPAFRAFSPLAATFLIGLVLVTGHLGGNLTHGGDFLVEYAPNFVRRAYGLDDARAPVQVLAQADPYLDLVRPMLASHCTSCHNADKRRGGLDLTRYAALRKGGEHGAVLVPGDALKSEMIRRVSLVPGDEDFMPKEGKAPLSAQQVAILRWWIDQGARTGIQIGSLSVPAAVQPLLEAQLHPAPSSGIPGVSSPGATVSASGSSAAHQAADPQLLAKLAGLGFMARQMSQSDARLIVSPIAPGTVFSASQVSDLVAAGGGQIVALDLRQARLDGNAVAVLGKLHSLVQLRLDRNELADADLRALSGLGQLEVLGLYGNESLSDACLPTLLGLPALKRVYLWHTHVTAAGVARARSQRQDLVLDIGDAESGAS